MEAKFTVFFALCAVAAIHADSDVQSQAIQWANEQLDWLDAHAKIFLPWVAEEIDNPDVNEDIKTLLIDFRNWTVPVIRDLNEKFAAIKQRPANPTPEELQQLKQDIREIQGEVTSGIDKVIVTCDEIYAHTKEDKAKSTSETNKDALDSIDSFLHLKEQRDKEWNATVNRKGDDITSQIP